MRSLIRRIVTQIGGENAARSIACRVDDNLYRSSYLLSRRGRRSARYLRGLKNRYWGARCFIIGNGPSIRQMDLSPLRSEYTFGLNRIYLLFESLGFATTFLVVANRLVLEQFHHEITETACEVFVSHHSSRGLPVGQSAVSVLCRRSPGFSTRPLLRGFWDGHTVTYLALQLAYYMGFTEVVLIGVDHAFASAGTAHQTVTSSGDDHNHFHPNYFGPGVQWQLPDLETSELAYRMARARYEAAGRSVIDATVGGKLTVFPKKQYDRLVG